MGAAGPGFENLQQVAQVVLFALGNHLYLTPHQVPHIALEPQAMGTQSHEAPEPHSLDAPADPCLQPFHHSPIISADCVTRA